MLGVEKTSTFEDPMLRSGLLLAREGATTVKEVLAKVYTLE